MRVILLTDVPKVGKKGEIKNVADGYGRNYLIARGLAVMESEASKKILDKQKKEEAENDSERRKEALELRDVLAEKTLVFKVKAKDDKVSGSVSTKQIEEELKKQGINVDKRKIRESEPLNSLGEFDVRIDLYKEVYGTIKVRLEKE